MAWALLCLAGQLLSLIHLLAVRHFSCPEHGELVDGVGGGAQPALGTADGRRGGGAVRGDQADEQGHHHCEVALDRRQQITLSQPGVLCPLGAFGSAPPWRTPADLPSPAIPLLHLAPKSSPPA